MSLLEPIESKMAELEPRERWMVVGCVIFVGLTAIWLLLWKPVQEQRSTSLSRAQAGLATLAEVKQGAATLALLKHNAPVSASLNAGTSLGALVDNSIRRSKLATGLDVIQPSGENSVKIKLNNVDFNALSEWLHEMKTRYQATATSVSIDATDEQSKVKARLTLER